MYMKTGGNTIYNNTIQGNNVGVSIYSSVASSGGVTFIRNPDNVSFNKIVNNQVGIEFYAPDNTTIPNLLYRNEMVNNGVQVAFHNNFANAWYFGGVGNYWSDYNGVDANGDGIGDTPYIINALNQDPYPIVKSQQSTPTSTPTTNPTATPTMTPTSAPTPNSSPTPSSSPTEPPIIPEFSTFFTALLVVLGSCTLVVVLAVKRKGLKDLYA